MTVTAPATPSVRVPFRLHTRGGWKRVMTADGRPVTPQPEINTALVKALARAHRWKRLLEPFPVALEKQVSYFV